MLTVPQELFFDLPNTGADGTHRLVCYQWGDPNAAKTIVCVHGLTRNGRDFDLLASALASNHRVLCPDMPGRGKSTWLVDPKGYNYQAYAADILALIKQLGLANIDWVGTSMGGIIGMMIANIMPGFFRSLILNDIGCMVPAAGLKRILSSADKKTIWATRLEAEADLRERYATFGIKEEAYWQLFFDISLEQLPDGTLRLACDPAIIAGLAQAEIKDVNLWPLWEAVKKTPVLLLRGEQSDVLPQDVALQMRETHLYLTYQEIPGCGHAPALMDGSQIEIIRHWLDN